MLWTAVPAASLWAASQLSTSKGQHYVVALPLTLSAMIVWGAILFALNALYIRVAALPDDESGKRSRRRRHLEVFLVWSLLIAFVAFLVWFFAFAENPGPGVGL
jgi:hypothetical protein